MTTYAKIAWYKGQVMPMHYHYPYSYWQFAWEKHRHPNGEHQRPGIDADAPAWTLPDSTMSIIRRYTPSEQEVAWYNDCLIKKTPPPISGETAYNMLKILGKLEAINRVRGWISNGGVTRGKSYSTIQSLISIFPELDMMTILLGAEYAINSKHL